MAQTVDPKMLRSWTEELEAVGERISAHFSRSEVRQRAQDYLRGLLSGAERKNSWQLAEVAGNATPYGIQHLLGRANWDADAVSDELREHVVERLADDESVLIVDETGFIKKGDKSVGVKRQYTGTVGKRENCQVGVFLAYASERGQAFIDRELYLPEEWALDKERRERAGVPEEVGMRTKPELAKVMLQRALDAGREGGVGGRRQRLRRQQAAWDVPRREGAALRSGRLGQGLRVGRPPPAPSGRSTRASGEEELVPEDTREAGFKRLSAGDGSKGPRLYDWLRLPLNPPHAGRLPEMALGAPLHRRSRGAQRLYGLRSRGHYARSAGEGSRQPLAGGDRL